MNLTHAAHGIYRILGRVTDASLSQAYSEGMIKKEDLVINQDYVGYSRNTGVATWTGNNNFVYTRTKFGSSYPETIVYPSDDEGYDIFVPLAIYNKETHNQ